MHSPFMHTALFAMHTPIVFFYEPIPFPILCILQVMRNPEANALARDLRPPGRQIEGFLYVRFNMWLYMYRILYIGDVYIKFRIKDLNTKNIFESLFTHIVESYIL